MQAGKRFCMSRKIYCIATILLALCFHSSVMAFQSNCVTVDSSLSISIPAIAYEGQSYQIVLNYWDNPADPSNPYWYLDMGSIGVGQPCGTACSKLSPDNLQIIIPCLEYKGSFFQAVLGSYYHPLNPSKLYWKLNSINDTDAGEDIGFSLNQAYNAGITDKDYRKDGYYFEIEFVPGSTAEYKISLTASGLTNPLMRLYLDDGNYNDLDNSGSSNDPCVSAGLISGSTYEVQVQSDTTGTFQLLWEEGSCGTRTTRVWSV